MLYSIGDSHQFRMSLSVNVEPLSYCNWIGLHPPFDDIPNPSDCASTHVTRSVGLRETMYFSGHKGLAHILQHIQMVVTHVF